MTYTGPAPDKNGEFSYPWQAIAYYGHQATHAPTEGERDRAARKLRDARMGALLVYAAELGTVDRGVVYF